MEDEWIMSCCEDRCVLCNIAADLEPSPLRFGYCAACIVIYGDPRIVKCTYMYVYIVMRGNPRLEICTSYIVMCECNIWEMYFIHCNMWASSIREMYLIHSNMWASKSM